MEALEQRESDHLRRDFGRENEKGTGWSQTGIAASEQEI